jgi:alanine racemase
MTVDDARMPGSAVCSAQIDLSAIRENAATIARRVFPRLLTAHVAGDGFGHGAVGAARAAVAGGVRSLAISDLDDAREFGEIAELTEITALRGWSGLRSETESFGDAVMPGESARVLSYVAGAELYGLTGDPELRAAMRVSALVVGTKTIEAGEGVSYGFTWRAPARTNLALIGIGYADGLDRRSSNLGSLFLGGAQRPIAGRVAMNALVLDLGMDTVSVGDEAVVFGDARRGEPSAASWAAPLGVSAAEVATVFGTHLTRVVV